MVTNDYYQDGVNDMSDEETNVQANGHAKTKLEQLLPGSSAAFGEKEEIVPLLTPDGDDIGVYVVFAYLDGQTKAQYDRIIQRTGKRGRLNFDEGNFLLFEKKCKRIEGLTAEDCDGLEPKVYFRTNKNGNILLHASVNEYCNRQLPSAGDLSKSI
jgi:hypothetical protein